MATIFDLLDAVTIFLQTQKDRHLKTDMQKERHKNIRTDRDFKSNEETESCWWTDKQK